MCGCGSPWVCGFATPLRFIAAGPATRLPSVGCGFGSALTLQDNLRSYLTLIELQRGIATSLCSSIEARYERRLSEKQTKPSPHTITNLATPVLGKKKNGGTRRFPHLKCWAFGQLCLHRVLGVSKLSFNTTNQGLRGSNIATAMPNPARRDSIGQDNSLITWP